MLQRQPVLDMQLRQPGDIESFDFEPRPAEVLAAPDAGVQIELAAASTWRVRVPVDLPAAEATAVEIETPGLRGRPLELRWRTAEGAAPTTPLTDYSPRDFDEGVERYRFVLRGVETWRGRIVELEFLSASPLSQLSLCRLGVWSERLDAEQVPHWQGRRVQQVRPGRRRAAGFCWSSTAAA